jgi:hypothetical protein
MPALLRDIIAAAIHFAERQSFQRANMSVELLKYGQLICCITEMFWRTAAVGRDSFFTEGCARCLGCRACCNWVGIPIGD